MKVTVLGASGGIGQPLSLLLKISSLVDELSLFDVRLAKGVATDLSHINTKTRVEGFEPGEGDDDDDQEISKALKGSDVVIIPAGIARKPGMKRDDLFKINAKIIKKLSYSIVKICPNANILVISNPVNSTVPIVCEVFKKHGIFNPKKIFGVTTLDVVRANSFLRASGGETNDNVNVIGGHSGETIVPIFSNCKDGGFNKMNKEDQIKLIKRVQFGGDEVVKAKSGGGSATLSMAYSGYKFAESIMRAMNGEKGIIECSFVNIGYEGDSGVDGVEGVDDVEYLAMPILLGIDGVESVDYSILNKMNNVEKEMFKVAIDTLKGNIKKGIDCVFQSKL